ncbi:MAG: tetratricopeptide repeat protein [Bdellovibrionaceae bacterium]|nr:tetratricopeptide repeat protein [Pseudobdellovibrionaceae bacterium]
MTFKLSDRSIFRESTLKFALVSGLLLLLVLIPYSESLNNRSTNWDDYYFVSDYEPIKNFDVQSIFSETTLGNYYPITIVTFAVDSKICDTNPTCYHVTSLLFHYLCVMSLFILIFTVGSRNIVGAFMGASLFAVHPFNVEAVSWIASRNQVVSTFFLLVSLTLYWTRTTGKRDIVALLLSAAFFGLALLSRPSAVAGAALFPLIDILQRRFSMRSIFEKALFALPSIAILIVTLNSRSRVEEVPIPEIFEMNLIGRLLTAFRSLVFYVSRALYPRDLRAYYDYLSFRIDGIDIFICLGLIAVLMIAFRSSETKIRRVVAFGILLFPIMLLTTIKIVPFGEYSIVHDRYAYTSVAGFCIFIGFVATIKNLSKYLKSAFYAAAGLVVAIFSYKTYFQTKTWDGSENLWRNVIAFEESAVPLNNLGIIFLKQGDLLKARPLFERAIAVRPRFSLAYFNLGEIMAEQGDLKSALDYYQTAVHLRPTYHEAYNNLGNIYSKDPSRLEIAKNNFHKSIENGADYPEPFYNIAAILAMQGKYDDALGAALKVTWKYPTFMRSYILVGDMHLKHGDRARARENYEKVVLSGTELSHLAQTRIDALK